MCNESFYVPKEQPKDGWWVGQGYDVGGGLLLVSVVWTHVGYRGATSMHVPANSVIVCESLAKAKKHIRRAPRMTTATATTTTATASAEPDKATMESMKALRARATIGYTPAMAKEGRQGKVFLKIAPGKAILVSIRSCGPIFVTIVGEVGISDLHCVGTIMKWELPYDRWHFPSREIYDALQQWKTETQSADQLMAAVEAAE